MARTRSSLSLVVLCMAASMLTTGMARADAPARARLIYATRDPKGSCASESDFRAKVASRLGYDPFVDDATWIFRIRIETRGGGAARAEIASEREAKPAGKRSLEDASCDALTETVASAVAIALDPMAGAPRRNEPAPEVASSPSPMPSAAAAEPLAEPERAAERDRPAEPRVPVIPFVYLDGTAALGRTAGLAVGGRAGGGVAYGALTVALEARAEATPGAVRITPLDRASWSVFSGGLALCGHKGIAELCGVGAVGTLQAKAEDVSRPSLKDTLFGLVGARLGVRVSVADDIAIRANGELGVPLVRTTFNIDGEPAWTAPAVQGTLAVGAEVRFR